MAIQYPGFDREAGAIDGVTGAAIWQTGGIVPARTGLGVYTLTKQQQVDPTQSGTQVSLRAAVAGFVVAEETSDAVVTVRTFNAAGAAADLSFNFRSQGAPLTG